MEVCRKHGSMQNWKYAELVGISMAAKGQGQPPQSREASFDAINGLRMPLQHQRHLLLYTVYNVVQQIA